LLPWSGLEKGDRVPETNLVPIVTGTAIILLSEEKIEELFPVTSAAGLFSSPGRGLPFATRL